MTKLAVIVKRPDEPYGHMTHISDRLENLQKTVGGCIETLELTDDDIVICNGEGKILGLEPNIRLYSDTPFPLNIVGTIIVIGTKGEEFDDIHMNFKTWKKLVDTWEGRNGKTD